MRFVRCNAHARERTRPVAPPSAAQKHLRSSDAVFPPVAQLASQLMQSVAHPSTEGWRADQEAGKRGPFQADQRPRRRRRQV